MTRAPSDAHSIRRMQADAGGSVEAASAGRYDRGVPRSAVVVFVRVAILASVAKLLLGSACAQDGAAGLHELRRVAVVPDAAEGAGIRGDGAQVAVSLKRGVVAVRDVATWKVVREIARGGAPTAQILTFFGDDGRWLALDTKGERVVEVASGKPVEMDGGMRSAFVAARHHRIFGSRIEVDAAKSPSGEATLAFLERAAIADRVRSAFTADSSAEVRIAGEQIQHDIFERRDLKVGVGIAARGSSVRSAVYVSGDEHAYLSEWSERAESMAFTADGRFLCLVRHTRMTLEPIEGGERWECPVPGPRAGHPRVAPGVAGPELWICDGRGLALWNATMHREVRRPELSGAEVPWSAVRSIAPSPDGRWVAVATDRSLYVVDLREGVAEKAEWRREPGNTTWSRDGEILFVGDPWSSFAVALGVGRRQGQVAPGGEVGVFRAGDWAAPRTFQPGCGVFAVDHFPGSHRAILAGGETFVPIDLDGPTVESPIAEAAFGIVVVNDARVLLADERDITLRRVPGFAVVARMHFDRSPIQRVFASPDRSRVAVELLGEVVVLRVGE